MYPWGYIYPRLGTSVLDDETIEWLLNTSPRSSAAKQWIEELAQTTKKKLATLIASMSTEFPHNIC